MENDELKFGSKSAEKLIELVIKGLSNKYSRYLGYSCDACFDIDGDLKVRFHKDGNSSKYFYYDKSDFKDVNSFVKKTITFINISDL